MNLKEKVAWLLETAADSDDLPMPELFHITDVEDAETAYYVLCLQRTNTLLDKAKHAIRTDVLNLSNRGDVERALLAYDRAYLLALPLSLDAVSEIAQDLISLARRYRCVPSRDWLELGQFEVNLAGPPAELAYPRKLADL